MRNRNTIEYLGMWEALNNPQFKGVEFDPLLREAGSNAFTLSPSRWIDLTDSEKSGEKYIDIKQREACAKISVISRKAIKIQKNGTFICKCHFWSIGQKVGCLEVGMRQ